MSVWFHAFTQHQAPMPGGVLNWREGGPPDAPVVVLLHGFPQTHAMWHRVAQQLVGRYRLFLPDLPGYGDSRLHAPTAAGTHPSSKRAMAQAVVNLLAERGVKEFHLCGHDRGARVAHRLALDHPQRVLSLTVIDIAPTLDMYEGHSLKAHYMAFARAYYHWFHLIQPHPLPEQHIASDPIAYLHTKLGGWGTQGLAHLETLALAEYERCWRAPEVVHAACEDYRASAGIDLEHDRQSRAECQRIACPLQVMWGEQGVVHRLFDAPALWRAQASGPMTERLMPAGHYIPEELPADTADALRGFIG